jgi:tetratricopeptide (TPR) repeat protein
MMDNTEKKVIVVFILLALSVIGFVFSPALQNDFTNWDDQAYVTQNKDLKNYSWEGLKHIYFSFYNANYHPLTMTSYFLEYHFFGLNPKAYHFTNITLHLINCVLIFWFIYLISGSTMVSFVTMVLFAIHPLNVEPVAWISERKGLLCVLFFLASLISYIYYQKNKKRIYYWFCLFAFILALLSKMVAITLPFILIIIDYYNKRKMNKEALSEKIPFFELSLIFSLIGIYTQATFGTILRTALLSPFYRIIIPFYNLTFYIEKLFFPINLSCRYPYPRIEEILSFPYLISPFVVAALATLIAFFGRYTRKIIFGTLFFLVAILPVLQLIPWGNSIAGDRHTYLALIGLFYLIGEFMGWLYSNIKKSVKNRKIYFAVFLIMVTAILSSLSWQRTKVWKNSVTLWSDVLKKYPNSTIAYNNRGAAYIDQGDYDEGIADCTRAIQITPDFADAYFNRASAYRGKGDIVNALADGKAYLEKSGFLKR